MRLNADYDINKSSFACELHVGKGSASYAK